MRSGNLEMSLPPVSSNLTSVAFETIPKMLIIVKTVVCMIKLFYSGTHDFSVLYVEAACVY